MAMNFIMLDRSCFFDRTDLPAANTGEGKDDFVDPAELGEGPWRRTSRRSARCIQEKPGMADLERDRQIRLGVPEGLSIAPVSAAGNKSLE
ncbi:MAG: hypothetical protein ACYCO5_13600 [Acidobacteriaceae bacterium]